MPGFQLIIHSKLVCYAISKVSAIIHRPRPLQCYRQQIVQAKLWFRTTKQKLAKDLH